VTLIRKATPLTVERTRRLLAATLSAGEERIASGAVKGFDRLRERLPEGEIMELVSQGNLPEVLRRLDPDVVSEDFAEFRGALERAVEEGAEVTDAAFERGDLLRVACRYLLDLLLDLVVEL